MKTPAAMLVFMCVLTVLGRPALGQITITTADVDSILAVGHSLANEIDKQATSLNIGSPGSTSWDFSALRSDSSQTLTSVTVSGTQFAGQFPSATHAFQASLNVVVGMGVLPAIAYLYFQRSTDLLNLGEGANIASGSATLNANNVPANIFYKLPSTYGTAWTSVYQTTTTVLVGGFPFSTTVVNHNTLYVVDAFGPMTLPDLSVHDALRIKKTDSTAAGKSLSYLFLARDGASVQVNASDPSQPESGIIQIQPLTAAWNPQVYALPIQLVSFNALQNPAGAGVLLRWSTLSEVNNYGFEIQRGAQPGGDFVSITGAFVPGHGTTTVPRDYSFADVSAPAGTWYYRLKQIDLDGTVHYSDPAKVDVGPGGTVRDVPAVFSLEQNFPNPFNPETIIRYGLPSGSHVLLALYNTLGERVAVLVEGEQESGFHEVRFNGSSLASGVYFYRLQAGSFVQTKKFSLLR
jgi:hypothetical protein